MKAGDIVLFHRKGPVSFLLGNLLKLIDKNYNGEYWHTGILWLREYDGWLVLEALASGVELMYHSTKQLEKEADVFPWLDESPDKDRMQKFFDEYQGKPYDIIIYFWIALALIIRHYWNKPIPRLLDNRFCCWELCAEFFEFMGKPIVSKYDIAIITDIVKAVIPS